jgi:beta-lactamase regulating signal transducer with metallopeptidase domain
MANDLYLRLAGTAASYFLQVFAGWLTCVGITRLSRSPRLRFFVWQSFVSVAAAYWLFRARSVWIAESAAPHAAVNSSKPQLYRILVPHAWLGGATALVEYLAAVYAAVVVLLLLRLVAMHITLQAALRHGRRVPAQVAVLFEEIRHSTGHRNCRLSVLPGIATPATVGILRPRILLPELFERPENLELLSDVIRHELAHVARNDYAWALLSDLAECFLFFHPAIWASRKQLLVQRELACDLAVIGNQVHRRADYAQCLTTFARMQMLAERAPMGIDFAGGASFLGLRVRTILAGPERASLASKLFRAGTATVLTSTFAMLCPLLVIWIAASTDSTAGKLRTPTAAVPLIRANHLRHSHAAHRTPGTPIVAPGSDHIQEESSPADRPAIFPPDGALSDDAFSASTILLASDDEPADLSNTARLGRTPGHIPLPGSPARATVTRDLLDNLGRLLTRIDRDPRPRIHR